MTDNAAAGRRPPQRDLIFDFGMNRCEDTAFYLAKGFRVVGIEANPHACAAANAQFGREIDSGQLTVLNMALSNDNKPLRFYICTTNSSWSTASTAHRDEWAARGAAFVEQEVPATTVAELVERFGVPYYAKIDLEGFDLLCLEGWVKAGARPTYLSFEVDFGSYAQAIAAAEQLGYREFVLVGQSTVAQQRIPDPPAEGRPVQSNPKRGSSGLFGAELPGPWISADALSRRCGAVVRQHRIAKALRLLYRVPVLKRVAEALSARHAPLARDWYDVHCR